MRALLIICMLVVIASIGVLATLKHDCELFGGMFEKTDAGYVCVRGKV